MAKAKPGRATPAGVKPPPGASDRKKAAVAPKRKAAGKVTGKGAVAKQPAPRKTVKAVASKKAAGRGGVSTSKKVSAARAGGLKAASQKLAPAALRKAVTKSAPLSKAISRAVGPKSGTAAARRQTARPPVLTPAARRARAARKPLAPATRSTAATPESKASVPQVFAVNHLEQGDFKAGGQRGHARYRDLGIAAASGGLCQAHVIRFTLPCTDEARERHTHQGELQLIYVLQGWMKTAIEGFGEQMMSAGSCWLQPPGVQHSVLDYSADCEVLEIVVPADLKTSETK